LNEVVPTENIVEEIILNKVVANEIIVEEIVQIEVKPTENVVEEIISSEIITDKNISEIWNNTFIVKITNSNLISSIDTKSKCSIWI
jgi:hypothetical protein